MRIFLLLAFVLLTSAERVSAENFAERIVGGEIVPDNRFPFMAAIYYDRDKDGTFFHGCGGSFIGERWILTAAHCVVDATTRTALDPRDLAVLLGERNLEGSGGEFIYVSRVYPHPDFDFSNYYSDIALLELSQDYGGTPLTLPSPNSDIPLLDEIATIAGWGNTSEGGETSLDLRSVNLPIVSHVGCFPYYQNSLEENLKFCAGGNESGGQDSCQGDSGGPLFVVRGNLLVQAGIVSHGEGCARPGIPGVYTRLTTFASWINSIATGIQQFDGVDSSGSDGSNSGTEDIPLLTLSVPESGTLIAGDVAVYDANGADQVNLETISGDADLYLLAGTEVTPESIICTSEEEGITEDSCDTDGSPGPVYAIVYGYEDSEYAITAVGTSVTNPVNDLPTSSPATAPATVQPATNSASTTPQTALGSFGGSAGGSTGMHLLLLLGLAFSRRWIAS